MNRAGLGLGRLFHVHKEGSKLRNDVAPASRYISAGLEEGKVEGMEGALVEVEGGGRVRVRRSWSRRGMTSLTEKVTF